MIFVPAISLTIGPGGSGGVFGRSLVVCANLGGSFGPMAHQVLPDITAALDAYALMGSAAVFSGPPMRLSRLLASLLR